MKAAFILATALCTTTLTSAQSQSFTPIVTYQALSAFVDGEALYVLGGRSPTDTVLNQMFRLDLSTSWNTADPAFKKLPDGYGDYSMPSAISADKQTWFVVSNGKAYGVKLETTSWKTLSQNIDISKDHGNAAATNPETGRIYAPNGYADWWTGEQSMMIYSTSNDSFYTTAMQPSMLRKRLYTAAWSPDLKGMLIFGGLDRATNATSNDLLLYSPDDGWRMLDTKGDIPPSRRSHCFVPAYSGSKMVLFGGNGNPLGRDLETSTTLGDIYILDVPSMTWTRGSDTGAKGARWGAACAVSGDYLIAWGGSTFSDSVLDRTIVYNLKTASWITDYVYVAPPKQANKNAIAIGCGVAGGVLVLGALVLIIRRHRANKRTPPTEVVEVPPLSHYQIPVVVDPSQKPNGLVSQQLSQGEYSTMSPPSVLPSPMLTQLIVSTTPAPMYSNANPPV
ncbi:hypothetical protein BGX31_004255 [Mortierella sp. GBA43]|nr:hypothetical protein BGX31_004255 [Mortierella sp. GBA43]